MGAAPLGVRPRCRKRRLLGTGEVSSAVLASVSEQTSKRRSDTSGESHEMLVIER